jgi:hypothetical protein
MTERVLLRWSRHPVCRSVGGWGVPSPIVARFLAVVAESPDAGASVRLCQACVAVLPVQRAAIVLHSDADGLELLCASDEVAARIEAVQATVGDGPGVDAITSGGPVLVADLATTGFGRWPAMIGTLDRDAPSAMFAFPLQVGAIRLGALDLYRETPQPLSSDDLASMTLVAQVVTMTLLNGVGGDGDPGWEQSPDSRTIHQATGMVVAQLGVPAREAYVRLQGHAFANGKLLTEVAEDVVARRLRLPSNGHHNG